MRKIRLDDGVFNKIVGSDREISSYERFINTQKGIHGDSKVNRVLDYYKNMVTENSKMFDQLSEMEDLIILLRIRANRDVQLYTQREYIYARQACPRDTKNRDIRVCVGRVDAYPDGNVLENPEVLSKADEIVCEYLDQLIKEKEFIVYTLIPNLNNND